MTLKQKNKIIKYLEKADKLLADNRNDYGYYARQAIAEIRLKIKSLTDKVWRI